MFRLFLLLGLISGQVDVEWSPFQKVIRNATQFEKTLETIQSLQTQLKQEAADEQTQLKLAIRLKSVHAYKASKVLLEALLKQHPNMHQAKYELAELLSTIDQPNMKTLRLAEACVEAEPKNDRYLQLFAQLQMRLSLFNEALQTYQTLSKLNPQNGEYTYQMALINHLAGNNSKAEEVLTQHFAQQPNSSYGKALAGRIAFAEGNLIKAEKLLRRAIALDPNNYVAHEELGKVYMELDKMDQAVTHFDRTIKANPFRLNTTIKYVQALARAGETETAKRFQNNIKILRHYDGSKRFYLYHLVDQGALNQDDHMLLATELVRLGFEKEAGQHLKAVLSINPKASGVAYLLARIALKEQKFEEILDYLEKVSLENHRQQEEFFLMKGLAFYQTGQLEKAAKTLQAGLKRYPESKQLKTIQEMVSNQRAVQ